VESKGTWMKRIWARSNFPAFHIQKDRNQDYLYGKLEIRNGNSIPTTNAFDQAQDLSGIEGDAAVWRLQGAF